MLQPRRKELRHRAARRQLIVILEQPQSKQRKPGPAHGSRTWPTQAAPALPHGQKQAGTRPQQSDFPERVEAPMEEHSLRPCGTRCCFCMENASVARQNLKNVCRATEAFSGRVVSGPSPRGLYTACFVSQTGPSCARCASFAAACLRFFIHSPLFQSEPVVMPGLLVRRSRAVPSETHKDFAVHGRPMVDQDQLSLKCRP